MQFATVLVENGEVDALVPERVWQELHKALATEQPLRMMAVLAQCGALTRILPGLVVNKQIEQAMGRREAPEYDADGHRIYHDRPIDIDILLYDDLRLREPGLTIPHPLMYERPFVMQPLHEIMEES